MECTSISIIREAEDGSLGIIVVGYLNKLYNQLSQSGESMTIFDLFDSGSNSIISYLYYYIIMMNPVVISNRSQCFFHHPLTESSFIHLFGVESGLIVN